NAFERADNLVYDRLIRFQGVPADDRIILVAIDDESVARIGRFPWPRTVHAEFLKRLAAARPRAIIYDVLFVDPSPGDLDLAKAVSLARPILPVFMEVPGRNGAPVSVDQPLPELLRAGARVGQANVSPDDDGIVRRVNLVEGANGRLWPHVAAVAACRALGMACINPQGETGPGYVRKQPYLIPFAGRRQHFRTVPFSAVLKGSVPDQFFKDRIVLVGATAAGLSDAYGTPMAERDALMPGVEVNANVLQGLVTGRVLSPASKAFRFIFALAPLWLLLAGFLLVRPRFNFFLGLSLALAVVAASALAFLEWHLWISPITALAGLLLIYPLWAWRRLEATSAFMRRELEHFHRDSDVFPSEHRPALEPVQSDIDLLGHAVGRARDLQRVVGDTLKALPDASLVIGASDGVIQFLNDRGHDLLGDADGRHFSWIVERLAKNRQLLGTAAPGPDTLPTQIIDDEDRIFDVRWSPIHAHDGKLVSWVVRLADVTALQMANRQREEALQLLTHDMRSPQASIIAALKQSPGAVEPRLAQGIEAYARRTLDLADGFVQLARAEAQPLHFEEINLVDALVDAIDDLWPLSSTKNIKVEIDSRESELLVSGDRGLVTRAIINLVGNAIKYSPSGSSVRCSVEPDQSKVRIGVCDSGPGLAEAQVANLFKPFEQGGKSIDGAGLGLAFVRSVALRHGGTISFRNNRGPGCCFELELPLATAA
ncbi:MAG TPA: CHASE2 domain-containing protein, partial [Sphingomicrobium sp.]|nr:CHASE2 domain-containing protein [Sphingomicrobium sp.]